MNPILNQLNATNQSPLRGVLSGDSRAMFSSMMQNNPNFAEFVRMNKGKSVEQIASDYGVDINMIRKFLK